MYHWGRDFLSTPAFPLRPKSSLAHSVAAYARCITKWENRNFRRLIANPLLRQDIRQEKTTTAANCRRRGC